MTSRSAGSAGVAPAEPSGVRRSPYGANPTLGARALQTRSRIVLAALQVFGERGYHDCRVDHVTAAAGCSRPSFYQYFSSKEEVFRDLAGEVARRLNDNTQALPHVSGERSGWQALRGWVAGSADLYDQYWPVFSTFSAAQGSDDALTRGAARVSAKQMQVLRHRLGDAVPAVTSDPLLALLLDLVQASHRYGRQSTLLGASAVDRERHLDSLTDVLHRVLFGSRGGRADVQRSPAPAPPADRQRAAPQALRVRVPGAAGQETRERLVVAGTACFADRGYHGTRVDDLVAAAGVSHGTFYRYFDDKAQVFQVVAGRSGRRLLSLLQDLPDVAACAREPRARAALRRWLSQYVRSWNEEGPVLRAWLEAMPQADELRGVTAAALHDVQARLTRFLAPRGFGDPQGDALILLAALDLGAARRDAEGIDRMLAVLRRGFLGIDARL